MKYLVLIIVLVIASCSNPNNVSQEIAALNGTWVAECVAVLRNGSLSGEYATNTYNFNNGGYTSNFTFYSDQDCINEISNVQDDAGRVTFIEEVLTESGVTAIKVKFERFNLDSIKPPTSESLLFSDSNNLYFGSFIDNLNIIFFDFPYMKKVI